MIEIKILKDKKNRRICVEAKGHANTAPQGQDMLCAAVSSQLLGISLAVAEMDKRRPIKGTVNIGFGEGIVDVIMATGKDFKLMNNYLVPAEAVFAVYEDSYPDSISMRIEWY